MSTKLQQHKGRGFLESDATPKQHSLLRFPRSPDLGPPVHQAAAGPSPNWPAPRQRSQEIRSEVEYRLHRCEDWDRVCARVQVSPTLDEERGCGAPEARTKNGQLSEISE